LSVSQLIFVRQFELVDDLEFRFRAFFFPRLETAQEVVSLQEARFLLYKFTFALHIYFRIAIPLPLIP